MDNTTLNGLFLLRIEIARAEERLEQRILQLEQEIKDLKKLNESRNQDPS